VYPEPVKEGGAEMMMIGAKKESKKKVKESKEMDVNQIVELKEEDEI